jgi:hypothetical protein
MSDLMDMYTATGSALSTFGSSSVSSSEQLRNGVAKCHRDLADLSEEDMRQLMDRAYHGMKGLRTKMVWSGTITATSLIMEDVVGEVAHRYDAAELNRSGLQGATQTDSQTVISK